MSRPDPRVCPAARGGCECTNQLEANPDSLELLHAQWASRQDERPDESTPPALLLAGMVARGRGLVAGVVHELRVLCELLDTAYESGRPDEYSTRAVVAMVEAKSAALCALFAREERENALALARYRCDAEARREVEALAGGVARGIVAQRAEDATRAAGALRAVPKPKPPS